MLTDYLQRRLPPISAEQLFWWSLWFGLVFMTAGLLVLMRTRWGQSNPMRKCIFLSLLAHLLLAGYASTVQVVNTSIGLPGDGKGDSIQITSIGKSDDGDETGHSDQNPTVPGKSLDRFGEPTATNLAPTVALPDRADFDPTEPVTYPRHDAPFDSTPRVTSAPLPADRALTTTPQMPAASPDRVVASDASIIDAPTAEQRETLPITPGPTVNAPDARPAATADIPQPAFPAVTLPPQLTDAQPIAPHMAEPPISDNPAEAVADLLDRLTAGANSQTISPAVISPQVPEAPRIQPGTGDGPDATAATPSGGSAGATPGAGAASGNNLAVGNSPQPGLPLVPFQIPDGPVNVPEAYGQRMAPDRSKIAQQHGATVESEAAVQAALQWLATSQSTDGRWDAKRFGAGREQQINGRDRAGAGAQADTGMTGLALLAFLGAGNTHTEGTYQETVRKGLDFLLRTQGPDGNLGGAAEHYAFMYCHGMATIALSEAFALSGDERLQKPLERALAYTLRCQHPQTGGWRYIPGELGDTSQLGWQLMVLKSAELAGIQVPESARVGAMRFLNSVAAGAQSGMASYRPRERATRSMTAEAMFCRQLLGQPLSGGSANEATKFLLEELPGSAQPNFYYWYYATLGLFQEQGPNWMRWNESLQRALLSTQRTDGQNAGSWDTNEVWGGHGGRVYTTAMAALCLEVYYRYLPLYGWAAKSAGRLK